MYHDTHAHLNLNYSKEEINEIIDESIKDKIYINIVGVDIKSSILAIEISKLNPKYFYSIVGIHPVDVCKLSKKEIDDAIDVLDNLIVQNRNIVKGVGETGLDFYHIKKDDEREIQFYSFQQHVKLAKKYNLPLVLHVRESHDEAIKFLKENKIEKVIIHCFSENIFYAKEYIKLGCKLSIPGIITFKNAESLKNVVKEIDINSFFLETDSPFLTPVPFRGKKNSPLYIKNIFEYIAKIKNMPLDDVCKVICKNSLDFFNI